MQLGVRLVANAKTRSSEEGRTKSSSQQAKTTLSNKTQSSSQLAKTTQAAKTQSSKEAKTQSSREAKTQSSREAKTLSSRAVASREEEEEEEKPEPKPLIDEQLVADVKAKLEYLAAKPQLVGVSVGGVIALWLTVAIVGALHDVPLLPKALELAGLGYIAWFVNTYLLQQAGREQLSKDVEALKEKVLGL